MRKALFSLLVLAFILFAGTAFAEDAPNMKGTWVCGGTIVASLENGIYKNPKAQNSLVIEQQEGRVFLGHKQWTLNGKNFTEKIMGGIARDGEIYIAEAEDGVMHGDLNESGDKLVIIYVESGPTAKVIELIYTKAK